MTNARALHTARERARMVRVPILAGTSAYVDPITGDRMSRITRESGRGVIYPPAEWLGPDTPPVITECPYDMPGCSGGPGCCPCIGYPCECGTAGSGC